MIFKLESKPNKNKNIIFPFTKQNFILKTQNKNSIKAKMLDALPLVTHILYWMIMTIMRMQENAFYLPDTAGRKMMGTSIAIMCANGSILVNMLLHVLVF